MLRLWGVKTPAYSLFHMTLHLIFDNNLHYGVRFTRPCATPSSLIPHQLPYLQANNDLPPCACQPGLPDMSGSLPFQILPPGAATSLSVCNHTPPRNDS